VNALGKLTLVEAKLIARDLVTVPVTLVLPVALLLAFGLPDFGREPDPAFGGRPVDTVLPSMAVTIAVAVLAFSVLPTYLATYRERGVLRRLATTPTRPSALLAAQLLVNLAMTLLALGLVLAVGVPVLDMALPRHLPGFLGAYALGLAAMFAVGLLIAAVAASARAATGWGMLAFFPSMFFAGIYLPKEHMPATLSRIGDFTPLGAFRQTVQDAWVGTAPEPALLVFLAVVAVGCGWAAARLFRWE
jgi:ABC-2 type transport system permease protein